MGACVSSGHFDVVCTRFWFRDWCAFLTQTLEVEYKCLADESLGFLDSLAYCNTTGQIRNIGSKARFALFNHNCVSHSFVSLPSCLLEKTFNVPGGMSRPGFPETVTLAPGLPQFANCLWLPFCRMSDQPSSCSRPRTSRTFIFSILPRLPNRVNSAIGSSTVSECNVYIIRRTHFTNLRACRLGEKPARSPCRRGGGIGRRA